MKNITAQGVPAASMRQQHGWHHWLPLSLLAALLMPLLCYRETAASVLAIWQRSDTYAHGYVVLPIAVWLIWRRRTQLANTPLAVCWWGMAGLLLCGMAWLAGALGDVQVVRQYALAAMLPLTALTLIGWRASRVLAFPLLFILLAVPIGENLIAPLIQVTASFTVEALRWTGIPVVREANHIRIPSGDWSVVEACSGLRYLISSFTLGCLYAYLTYRNFWRRTVFVLASIVVPIVANGLRAYMIIMLGHLSGMKLAVGVDHLIYGWAFFGLVMLLLFWLGSYWRDDDAAADATNSATAAARPAGKQALAALAALLCMVLWPAYWHVLERRGAAAPAWLGAQYRTPLPAALPFTDWSPDYAEASAGLREFVRSPDGDIGVIVRYFRNQPGSAKLISSSNQLTAADSHWRVLGQQQRSVAGTWQVRESVLGNGAQRLLLWQWYLIGDAQTASDYQGKLLQAKQKLSTGRADGVVVMIFSSYNKDVDIARISLNRFLASHGADMQRVLSGSQQP